MQVIFPNLENIFLYLEEKMIELTEEEKKSLTKFLQPFLNEEMQKALTPKYDEIIKKIVDIFLEFTKNNIFHPKNDFSNTLLRFLIFLCEFNQIDFFYKIDYRKLMQLKEKELKLFFEILDKTFLSNKELTLDIIDNALAYSREIRIEKAKKLIIQSEEVLEEGTRKLIFESGLTLLVKSEEKSGSFGTSYKSEVMNKNIDNIKPKYYAIKFHKEHDKIHPSFKKAAKREAKYNQLLGREAFFYFDKKNDCYNTVYTWQEGKTIATYIASCEKINNENFSLIQKFNAITNLLEQLATLEKKRLCHYDYNGGNLLFNEKTGLFSIIDFGMTRRIECISSGDHFKFFSGAMNFLFSNDKQFKKPEKEETTTNNIRERRKKRSIDLETEYLTLFSKEATPLENAITFLLSVKDYASNSKSQYSYELLHNFCVQIQSASLSLSQEDVNNAIVRLNLDNKNEFKNVKCDL